MERITKASAVRSGSRERQRRTAYTRVRNAIDNIGDQIATSSQTVPLDGLQPKNASIAQHPSQSTGETGGMPEPTAARFSMPGSSAHGGSLLSASPVTVVDPASVPPADPTVTIHTNKDTDTDDDRDYAMFLQRESAERAHTNCIREQFESHMQQFMGSQTASASNSDTDSSFTHESGRSDYEVDPNSTSNKVCGRHDPATNRFLMQRPSTKATPTDEPSPHRCSQPPF